MSQVGRISGPLLNANLERNGIDLKITNTASSTPVLKFDVTGKRIGIGTDNPISELQVPSSLNVQNLIATGTVSVADFTLSNQEINVNSGNIIVNSGSLIEASAVATDAIKIEENNIYGTTSNEPIELKPSDSYWNEQDSIVAGDPEAADEFGISADISGDYAIVGAFQSDDAGASTGSAYIFKRTGNTWTQQQKLLADDAAQTAYFGTSVAIDGDTVIVGATGVASNAGAAYIFTRTGNTWTQQQKIVPADLTPNSQFGTSVDIQAETVVIGAWNHRVDGTQSTQYGAAYVWTRSGSTWTQQQKLEHPSPVIFDGFGRSVSLAGNTIAVGVPGRELPSYNANGSVVVFTITGSTWSVQQEIVPSDPTSLAQFGRHVDNNGDDIIVGVPSQTVSGIAGAGAVYVFRRTGSTWTQQQKIIEDTATSGSFFGTSVAIEGNTLLFGSTKPFVSGDGTVLVYKRTNSVWSLAQTLVSSDSATNKFAYKFGDSIGIDNGSVIIGESGNPGSTTNEGAAYIFTEAFSKIDIQSDLDVDVNLHATGNITFGGTITLGSGVEDDVTFAADVASDIVPDVDNFYIFGRDTGLDSTTQRLGDTIVDDVTATNAVGDAVIINGVNYALGVGNSFFVAEHGDDTNRGDHPQGAFRTIKHALSAVDSSAGGPTTIHIMAGSYTEEFPLTVPSQTNIVGAGFREVEIKPTTATQDKDCFLLTGETTVSNVTLMDYFYNSSNDTGYGFRFANNAITSTRSPYIQNVSVITKGTPISVTASTTLSVNAQETNPRGITFNNDGTKMFIVGTTGDDVNEYTVSTGFDLSSTVTFVDSFAVTQCPNPTAVKFNTDGTKMFVTGVGNNNVHEYALSTGFDVSTASFTQTLVTTVDNDNFGLDFNNDGTKMYITGNSTDSIYEFNLSSAFNISTATLNQSVYLNAIDDEPFGIEFNTDGTRMFIVGTKGNGVDEFKLTTGFDISTATHMGFYFVGNNPSGIHISPDGTKMFIIGNGVDLVKSYDLGTSYRVSQDGDPRGFEVGNAGRGALVDGSVLDANSTQASMLFHSVTFITPGAIGLRMKDGVRVEWLNSFTYFADVGIKAENGSTGFVSPHDGSTRNYGAEIRSIGSANVYGNQGAVADGSDCLMYLIQHNMAYIGTGSNKENDQTLRIEANETVELNSGKIYFQTTDAQGKFKVGDNFFADFETGTTSIDANTVAFDTLSEIRINTGSETTFIDGTRIDTGNLLLSGNKISSSTGNLVFDSITNHDIRSDVSMSGKLDISGNFSIGQSLTRIGDQLSDTVTFNMDLDQDLKPGSGGLRSLGSDHQTWKDIFVSEANIDDIRFFDNVITTTASNTDLEFAANGTGNILLSSNNLEVDNNLEAGKLILPSLTYIGNTTQTGDIATNEKEIIGTLTVDNINVARDAFLKQIDIVGGNITNTVTNSDLTLTAIGTGKVRIPGNNVKIDNDISVDTYTVGGNIFFTGDVDSNVYSTDNIRIFQNNIETTQSNSDLELRGTGTGSVLVENLFFNNRTITSGPPGVTNGKINFAPAGNLILSGTGALKFPVGNSNQRRNETGDVRFNSQLGVFEGFSTGTVTFGGVFSDDQQTSVQVHPTNNHLDFNVDGSLVGTINIAQVEMPGLQADDVLIDGKKITTVVSNSDLELTPNGTGTVNIIGNTINLSSLSSGIIKNDSTGALTISATDDGYHKIGGTFGVRIPTGDNSNRDAGDSVPNQIGDTRYNNTGGGFLETWDGNVWQVSAGGGGETVSQEEMENLILEFSLALG
mgnify:CR=1 FL=1